MLIRHIDPNAPRSYEIPSEREYLSRRDWIKAMGLAGAAALSWSGKANAKASASPGSAEAGSADAGGWRKLMADKIASRTEWPSDVKDPLTPYEDVTTYNNFYEFGTGKSDPARNSKDFKVDPWSLRIEGEVGKPITLGLEDLLRPHQLEDRVYRFRCVEAWSMVVPWLGIPLAELIKRAEPTSKAKYVRFETLVDPKRFPAQRPGRSTIDWPYVEGLRIDEAMHPLSLMVVGVYGKPLLPQNGAPLRLIVPWKYGFKSIKSIVRIQLTEQQPQSTWEQLAAHEYGFYANVNPEVSHPRWSQSRERRLPNSLWDPNWVPTLKFNGYEQQVAHLYQGMNLRKNY